MTATEKTSEDVANIALSAGRRLGCKDIAVMCERSNDSQVRFANNVVTLVNNVRNVALSVYVSKERKRMIGVTFNPAFDAIERFVSNLVKSCESLPVSPDYVPLPEGPFTYHGRSNFDPKVADVELVGYVKHAIDKAISAGAKRVSGSLNTESSELSILTSGGASGKDMRTQILLNIRAFADDNASGQGLSCSSYLSSFDSERAAEKAGMEAKLAINPKTISDGYYDVVLSPTVIANIFPIASNASAFAIESGDSFLEDKLGKEVAVPELTVEDYGVYAHGLGGRIFDDEGIPTRKNSIISKGKFVTMLHNCTTAKKFQTASTGNAGIIGPRPFTVVFSAGDSSIEEMVKETKNGVMITNNWYTRYQNVRTGDYSTVPRDAAFRIQNGEITESIAGLRVSDSIPRQLESIQLISEERDWIRWWEVNTPTYAPAMKISGVHLTKAAGI